MPEEYVPQETLRQVMQDALEKSKAEKEDGVCLSPNVIIKC